MFIQYLFSRTAFKLLLIAELITITANSQTLSSHKSLRVQHAIESLFAALTEADTMSMKKFTTNTVRFYEYGEVWPLDTLINKVMKSKATGDIKRTNKFEFVSTTIHKNIAWATYYLQSTFRKNGKEELVKWMETVVLKKEKKHWKIDVLHSTRLTKK